MGRVRRVEDEDAAFGVVNFLPEMDSYLLSTLRMLCTARLSPKDKIRISPANDKWVINGHPLVVWNHWKLGLDPRAMRLQLRASTGMMKKEDERGSPFLAL